MKHKIKMIGMDLDGTLLADDKKVTAYTREVLLKAIRQGVVVLVATGRPLSAIPEELLTFPGMRYIVTANGAQVLDLQEDVVLEESSLSATTACEVLRILKDYDVMREIFVKGIGYGEREKIERVEDFFETASMRDYIRQTRIPVESLTDTLSELHAGVDKVHAIFNNLEERKEARERILQLDGVVVTGAFGNTLEINKEGTSKAESLIRLGQMLGIEREEIMACGDGMNDYEMIEKVGFGVAMENGNPKVKEIADYVTVSNEEDGVAKAIEKFVLEENA